MADNALEFRVLTANGTYATANAAENADLYWALKGGGPAAFAVVLSTTFATFPDLPSVGLVFNINSTHTTNSTLFWEAVRAFHAETNRLVGAGLYVYFELLPGSLHVQPVVAINQTAAQLSASVAPLLKALADLGLPLPPPAVKEYPTFYDLYLDLFEDETAGGTSLTGGWTFVKEDVAARNDEIVASFRSVLDAGGIIIGHMWDGGSGRGAAADSSIHPRFRSASDKVIAAVPVASGASIAERDKAQHTLTHVMDDALRKAGPNGCAYVNEVSEAPRLLSHFSFSWFPP